jgi:hypothetical protein
VAAMEPALPNSFGKMSVLVAPVFVLTVLVSLGSLFSSHLAVPLMCSGVHDLILSHMGLVVKQVIRISSSGA